MFKARNRREHLARTCKKHEIMSWIEIHRGLGNASTLFVAILAMWALYLSIRALPLTGGWFGAAVICEVLILVQAAVGGIMLLQGLRGLRPDIHILYAIITLPAGYGYFSNIKDSRTQALGMAIVCAFLWEVTRRAGIVAAGQIGV
jgi:heme A synthase